MKRNGGIAAGVLAVLALVGVSNLPTKSSEASPAAETKKGVVPSGKPLKSGHPYAPCAEIAKRLHRLVTDTRKPVENWELPPSCYESERPKGLENVIALEGVRFAIATVPNPISTHLPLMFDRLVEAIQQAAQDDNYSYDTSWFPWDDTSKTYELLEDQRAAEDLQQIQQAQPGVIVFRRRDPEKPYDGGLIVLVVGEQPTGGISDDQFDNALAWIGQLKGPSDGTLRILGPTFSGSLPSLRRELDRNPKGFARVFVSSGTVSSELGSHHFDEWLKNRLPESYFWTAMESDSVMANRFCEYLSKQEYQVRYVAFLSEDETAFGAKRETPSCGSAINLYYPRDIATLRSAYQQQSILNPAKPQANTSAPFIGLRGDLSEPYSNDHDTVRSYGGQLTPLAQESILLDITNRLNDKRIQFIILRSTNSLDQIFLSQFLRRSYPEGRVVIDGADSLFSRGAEAKSLRGVMALSTYPLLTAQQDWTPSLLTGPSGSYRTFGEDTSEGEYIAARELFRDSREGSDVPIRDYGSPAWAMSLGDELDENRRPATWLTVVGRRQFWPLAVLNSNTLANSKLSGKLQESLAREDGVPTAGDASPLHLPIAMWMCLLACFVWILIHLYFCVRGSIMGSPRARTYFAPVPKWQHPALIAFSSAVLAMLGVSVTAGSGLFAWIEGEHLFHEWWTGVLLLISLLVSLIVPAFACWKNYRLKPVRASDSQAVPDYWRLLAACSAIAGLLGFILVQIYLIQHLTQADRIPAYWRSVNLVSGASGLLPEIFFIAGAYIWFWFSLRGLAHFGEDAPRLPKRADLPMLDPQTSVMPMFSDEDVRTPIEQAALPLARPYLMPLLAIFVIAGGVCWVAFEGRYVSTLGEAQFGKVIFGWVCISVGVIVSDGIQTWRVWNQLRQLLIYLDRLPLRRTLRALKGLAWGSIWKMSGNVFEERYRVISLQLESLRHLTNAIIAWAPDNEADADGRSELLRKLSEFQSKQEDFVRWFVTLPKDQPIEDLTKMHEVQLQLASIAGTVMKTLLLRAWRTETESLIFGRSTIKPAEGEKPELDIPINELKPHVRAAEEFFVLPYLAFIQNILGRIRTIALGGLWLFVGATLAVSSYPFEPLSVLGGIFLTVFVVVGGLTVLVYSQMSRDTTLSHITNTQPGELGWDFWLRLVGFGIGPLLGLLTTLFPTISDFVFSWLQPNVQALQ